MASEIAPLTLLNHNNKHGNNVSTTLISPGKTLLQSPIPVSDTDNSSASVSASAPTLTSTSNSTATSTQDPYSPSRRSRRVVKRKIMADVQEAQPNSTNNVVGASADEEEEENSKPTKGKSRRELPAGAVATLKAWLLSPEHFTHPYPTPQDQIMLMQKTGIDKKQLKNWFTNARRRIWKPMLKKQLEQGKMTQTGSGAVVALPGATVGGSLMTAPPTGAEYGTTVDHSQVMQNNYQQALQQPTTTQQQQYDSFGNPVYTSQPTQPQQQHPQAQTTQSQPLQQYSNSNYNYQQGQYQQSQPQSTPVAPSNSIGSLPLVPGATPPGSMSNLNKTDSHAVLMELFARDQDLVRQATEGAKQRPNGAQQGGGSDQIQQQQTQLNGQTNNNTLGSSAGSHLNSHHPMSKMVGGGSSLNKLGNVPSLNSWPHFSSVSSLNNLGTMTGVKSITNMSGADLVSQGSLNKKGNLAQVKSIENMGRADSYAFLEVFFDNAPSSSISGQTQRGVKREREEDDNVGLSLDGDDNPPANTPVSSVTNTRPEPAPSSLPSEGQDKECLKRAYDDAMAARGLISVSRSSEKLTDLALPAKMQRTISQEYLKSMAGGSTTFTSFSFNTNPTPPAILGPDATQSTQSVPPFNNVQTNQQQTPPQQPQIQKQQQPQPQIQTQPQFNASSCISTICPPANSSIEVPATTKCAICQCINVDTQLRPCGHMFHGRCLKPSLQNAVGPPKCPIDGITMQSAVLAVPTDENATTANTNNNNSAQSQTSYPPSLGASQEVTKTSSV